MLVSAACSVIEQTRFFTMEESHQEEMDGYSRRGDVEGFISVFFWGGVVTEECVFCVSPQAGFIKSRGDSDNHSNSSLEDSL